LTPHTGKRLSAWNSGVQERGDLSFTVKQENNRPDQHENNFFGKAEVSEYLTLPPYKFSSCTKYAANTYTYSLGINIAFYSGAVI
tara:strand:- start:7122 stop:7376 length:255 start_codon:yes stop_codon:yes gene_type:complete